MSTLQEHARPLADGLWIGGREASSSGDATLPVIDPASGQTLGTITDGTAEDVDRAVTAAVQAGRGEWATSPELRARCLDRLSALVAEQAADLARLDSRDTGRVHAEATAQIGATARWYRYFAGLTDKVHGQTTEVPKSSMLTFTLREPLGVIACITAWNAPLLLAGIKLAPALAAGNTVVLKPSEFASGSTLALARLCTEAGMPDGVVNVVTGTGASVGEPLVTHPGVAHVSFTGSPHAGARIAASAGSRLKGVTLELGGKSPNIIFADADLDVAVPGVLGALFSLSGQSCIAGSRVLVERPVYDRVVEELSARAAEISVGGPHEPGSTMGPIANLPQLQKVEQHAHDASQSGARLVAGGHRVDRDGYYFAPTIYADVAIDSRLAQEEVFGPIMAVIPFDDEQHALELANATPYGLAAGVWTRDGSRSMRMARGIQAGTVFVNTYRVLDPGVPFGGYKSSGLGRENGIEAMLGFTQVKSVWIETDTRPLDASPAPATPREGADR